MVATSLSFTEKMSGFVHFAECDCPAPITREEFRSAAAKGEYEGSRCEFLLTITIDDIDAFCRDPELTARADGRIEATRLGEALPVAAGIFNLFVKPRASTGFNVAREMHYLLPFRNRGGKPFTLYGFKAIEREDGSEVWSETTTLYTRILAGHHLVPPGGGPTAGLGILTISPTDFAEQLTTFTSNADNLVEKSRALLKFVKLFSGNLWEAYAPFFLGTESWRWNEHLFPVQTLRGVVDCEKELLPFDTGDGLTLTLQRFRRGEGKEVVLLIHGLTTSTDMFIMPEHYNLVQYLLDHGVGEVWSLDWRGSGRFTYNLIPHRFTVDDVAIHDIPAALAVIREKLGAEVKIHVIAHCVGSLGLFASVAAGFSKNLASIISNSVSLTPRVPWLARLKLLLAPGLIEYVLRYPYISPQIPYMPGPGFGKWLFWMERLIRRECREPACHMVSFMWGWGFPAAYVHANLSPVTHRRLKDLFGGTAVHYFRHISRMVKAGESLPYRREGAYRELPESYLGNLKQIELPPTLFVSGARNLIFPGSNRESYERVKALRPEAPVEYLELPNYGHQDVFMGKNCDREVFPALLAFLQKNMEERA
jgi:triacylglycerol lipase/cholesterol oxidase